MKKKNEFRYISGICAKENKKGDLMLRSSKLGIPIYRIYDLTKNSFEWVIENLTDDIQKGKLNCLIINSMYDLLKDKSAIKVFIEEVIIKNNTRLILMNKGVDIIPSEIHMDKDSLYDDIYERIIEE